MSVEPNDSDKPVDPAEPAKPAKDEPLVFGLSDAELQKELAEYKKALEQEFELAKDPNDRASENVEMYTRDFFKKNLAHAAASIVWLSSNSNSDSVRANCCKFIIQEAIADARADGDPIRDLLRELTANQPSHQVPTNATN